MKRVILLLTAFIHVPGFGQTEDSQICAAATAAQFHHCVQAASAADSRYSQIQVTAPITCDDSANLCQFTLANVYRHFRITGIGEGAGFHRSGEHGGYQHNTLTITGSTGPIVLQDLVFDEGKNLPLPYDYVAAHDPAVSVWTNQISTACQAKPAPPGKSYLNPCAGNSLRITSSSNITVENVQFLEAKNFGIQIDTSSANINITRSTFIDAWFNALWSQNNGSIRGLHIVNNTFKDNRSNALEISAVAPQAPDTAQFNTVIGNVFENNHNTGLFFLPGCHGIGNVCGGGQLLILSKSSDFQIEGNEIRDGGGPDTFISKQHNDVRGVEIDNTGISNITITKNSIHHNSGPAIDIAYNTKISPLAYNIRVYGNRLTGNDAMNFGSPFNNEWFLNSQQNMSNNGVVPKNGCTYVPSPLNAKGACAVLPKVKPYDWDNGTP